MSTRKATLAVKGMHCISCVRRVEGALTRIDGVAAVKVDLAAGRAVVEYAPERATEGQLKEAVRQLGFEVAD